jgi:hypothetical protein
MRPHTDACNFRATLQRYFNKLKNLVELSHTNLAN